MLDVLDGEIPDPLLALLVLAKTLARIGYRPQLVRCALCGADLPSDGGWVGFIPAHGGAVCRSCAGPEEARIPALLLRALEAGLRQPLRSRGELGFSEREVDLAGRLVERFFRFHIGFELRSEAFVRQVFADSQPGADSVDAASGRGDTAPPSDPHPAPARLEPPSL